MATKNTADIGFEKEIWDAACVLRGNMDASEYKNVILGLIFLKYISDSFDKCSSELPAILEHRMGKGVATIVTSLNYPGNPAVYPLYRAIIREIITSSARECDIKLIGNDRVRYAVYEGKRIYLLNTDYDMSAILL